MFKKFQIARLLSLLVILFTAGACLDLEPETAINNVGTDHTVTATFIIGEGDEPGTDVLVTFTVISGPNEGLVSIPDNGECTPNNDCTTDGNGQVSWTYSSVIPGTDIIVASVTVNNPMDGTIDIPSDPVEKIWVIPTNVPTLSEWGLIAMAGILGIVGFMVIRRRKVTA